VLGIGEQRVRKLVLSLELGVRVDRVGADAKDYGVDSLEPREGVAKAARLDRSARGVVLGIEEEDNRTAAQRRERERFPFVGRQREIGSELAGREHWFGSWACERVSS
jgi:hypothetical protein